MLSGRWRATPSLFIIVAAAVLIGLAIGWSTQFQGGAPAPAPVSEAMLSNAPATEAAGAARETQSTTAQPEIPPGVTRAQWQALQAQLGAQPGGPAELARIADYLRWSDLVQRLRIPIADSAERLRLARAIDAGLETHLHAGEVSAAEARRIKAAILEVTQPDETARAAELQRWTAAQATPARPDPRQAEFERRQAALVAAWSAQEKAKRDPAALERELEILRREVFGAPAVPR